ncbi:hypothetical protein O53_750 [Microcystis aeruginosa TAIHU98]|uniref:Uncharacterized protein n=1 Tax=Microcystis aeruginosa TAIHU98 TaxID=1134457 RepID=L7E9M9_MICAE|nr:hypothetical protein O53_750 [Microcystis aeruginosa TAIHU98]
MYIEKVPNRNYPPAVLRPDSYQEGDQVKKKPWPTARLSSPNTLSKLPDDIIDNRYLQKL